MAVVRRQGERSDAAGHESFLRHRRFLWLKAAVLLSLAAVTAYCVVDVGPRPSGGTWYGYLLGVISTLLIVWLTLLGLRKRVITPGKWSLKGWVSAHVYLGLSLLVLATLHTAFHFGWNVHTLAYGLMLLVIASGFFGVVVYAKLPARLSDNRGEMTQRQMLENIAALDRQLDVATQPLDRTYVQIVRLSLEHTDLAGGFWPRLTGVHRNCGTARAIAALAVARARSGPGAEAAALDPIAALLERKSKALAQAREHIRLRTLLDVWLKVHVPATFALLAALTAHIVSVFFYW